MLVFTRAYVCSRGSFPQLGITCLATRGLALTILTPSFSLVLELNCPLLTKVNFSQCDGFVLKVFLP